MFIHPISLLAGWALDLLFGDPARLPHPIVWFGRMISFGEKRLNRGSHRKMKGALMAIFLIVFVFAVAWLIRWWLIRQALWLVWVFDAVGVFYCLAGTTLIREVRAVFVALDRSLEEGRAQVARIVGRNHASPNSGYPEAALASILDCQFGGPHKYFGELFDKPFIGENDRELSTADMKTAVRVNRTAEVIMVIIVLAESAAILLLSR